MPGYPIPALILFIFAFIIPQEREVRFVSESITMRIEKDHFSVSGMYYYENDGENNILLTYPFPVGPEYGSIDSLYLFNLTLGNGITNYKSSTESILFNLELDKNKETVLQVSYRQKLNSSVATYIIKSTRAWKAPLESAYYQLIVPGNIQVIQFSILPDDSLNTGQEKVYFWKKYHFMPDKDMVFDFKYAGEE